MEADKPLCIPLLPNFEDPEKSAISEAVSSSAFRSLDVIIDMMSHAEPSTYAWFV